MLIKFLENKIVEKQITPTKKLGNKSIPCLARMFYIIFNKEIFD